MNKFTKDDVDRILKEIADDGGKPDAIFVMGKTEEDTRKIVSLILSASTDAALLGQAFGL